MRFSLAEMAGKLRGKVDTTTTLTLLRAGSATPLTITVERRTITLPGAELTIRLEDGKLLAEATGIWSVFEIEKGQIRLGSGRSRGRISLSTAASAHALPSSTIRPARSQASR